MYEAEPRRRRTGTPPRAKRQKLLLTAGFLGVAFALAAAYRSRSPGYEQSIYTAAPEAFWVGIGVAVIAGAWVAAAGVHRRRDAAHVLLTLAVLSVFALPLLRGYFFYGAGDSLTHLGWASEMREGAWGPLQSLYPAVHLAGILLEGITGLALRQALLLVALVAFPLAFVVFVSLDVAIVSRRPWAATIGVLSALLFVPVNGITIHPMLHPSSQAVLFAPLVFYLLFRYVTAPEGTRPLWSASGAALAVAGVALVLYHPQEAMDLVAILVAIGVLQWVVRRRWPDNPMASHRSIRTHAVLVGAVFLLWTFRHPRAQSRLEFVVEGLVGEGPETLDQTAAWSSSVQAIGGSTEVLFLKVFGVSLVFGALAAAMGYRALANGGPRSTRDVLTTYLVAALAPLGVLTAVVFLADQGDHYFRFLGFLAVPITILGGIAAAEGIAGLGGRISGRTVVVAICAVFAVLLLAQAAGFHQSPYVYKSNQQVTESAMEGYETTFEYREAGAVVMGVRGGPRRYVDALYGTETADASPALSGATAGVPPEVFNENLGTAYADDRYLATNDGDYQREVELYQGLRYSEAGFERLRTDAAIARVMSNGDVELYRVDGADAD